jgi:hypothetical protein
MENLEALVMRVVAVVVQGRVVRMRIIRCSVEWVASVAEAVEAALINQG